MRRRPITSNSRIEVDFLALTKLRLANDPLHELVGKAVAAEHL
jgi:hypothetical protein